MFGDETMKKSGTFNTFVVITDCFGPAWHYLPIFTKMGIGVLNLVSSRNLAAMFPDEAPFDGIVATLLLDESVDALQKALAGHKPVAVLAGLESGVQLADEVASRLGLPGNELKKSATRRNKYKMQMALAEADIASTKTTVIRDTVELVNFAEGNRTFPVVVKPAESAGTDGVRICHTLQSIVDAGTAILRAKNIFGQCNDTVLVQEYLDGPEYIVNTISVDGQHYVAEIRRGEKILTPSGCCVYDCELVLNPAGELETEIINYVFSSLTALGIKYGPAHSELKYTHRGPVLLETGARLSGVNNPRMNMLCFGYDTTELAVFSYLDASKVVDQLSTPCAPKKFAMQHFSISEKEGLLIDAPIFDTIQKIPSYLSHRSKVKIGQRIEKTVDLQTTPIVIELVHDDPSQIAQDHAALREMEKDGFVIEKVTIDTTAPS